MSEETKVNIGRMITVEMIEAWAKFHGTSLEDGSQLPGIIGSLTALAEGNGELPAKLFDAEETREVFAPVRSAYFAALGKEEPGYSNLSGEVGTQE